MAATAGARRLTEEHRTLQVQVAARTVTAMRDLWPLMEPTDVDSSFGPWSRSALPVIAEQHTASARLGGNYLSSFKALELGLDAEPVAPLLATLNTDQVLTSLYVTGPIEVKKQMAAGRTLGEAMDRASASSASSALRLALNGGRDTISDTLSTDPQARGWARVTSRRCCSFCAMLAARGPVYGAASVRFRAHDGCACTVEPVYRPDAEWPPSSRRWAGLWDEAVAADGDTATEFRRLVEAA